MHGISSHHHYQALACVSVVLVMRWVMEPVRAALRLPRAYRVLLCVRCPSESVVVGVCVLLLTCCRENAHQWAAAQQQRHEEARKGLRVRSQVPTPDRFGRAKKQGMKRSKSLEVCWVALLAILLLAWRFSRGALLLDGCSCVVSPWVVLDTAAVLWPCAQQAIPAALQYPCSTCICIHLLTHPPARLLLPARAIYPPTKTVPPAEQAAVVASLHDGAHPGQSAGDH